MHVDDQIPIVSEASSSSGTETIGIGSTTVGVCMKFPSRG